MDRNLAVTPPVIHGTCTSAKTTASSTSFSNTAGTKSRASSRQRGQATKRRAHFSSRPSTAVPLTAKRCTFQSQTLQSNSPALTSGWPRNNEADSFGRRWRHDGKRLLDYVLPECFQSCRPCCVRQGRRTRHSSCRRTFSFAGRSARGVRGGFKREIRRDRIRQCGESNRGL